jgi:hypothetical protein
MEQYLRFSIWSALYSVIDAFDGGDALCSVYHWSLALMNSEHLELKVVVVGKSQTLEQSWAQSF